jgi:hypothetical protein
MEELKDFYTRFLSSMTLQVEDGVVMVGSNPMTVSGYPVELYDPNKRYIIDGSVRAVVFNLLHENLIKFRNPAKEPITKRVIEIMELNLNLTLKAVLVSFIQNQINKVDYSFGAIKLHSAFFTEVEQCKKSAKVLYDEKMLSLYISLLNSEEKLVSLHYRTNVDYEGEKVPSALVVKHALLTKMEEEIDEDFFSSYRRKDIDVLKVFLNHMSDMVGTKLAHSIKSEYTVAITLTKAIIRITDILKDVITLTENDSGFESFFRCDVSYSDIKRFKELYNTSTMLPYIDIESKKAIEYENSTDATTTEKEQSGNIITPLPEIQPQPKLVNNANNQIIGYDNYGQPVYGMQPQTQQPTMQIQPIQQQVMTGNVIGYDNYGQPIYGQAMQPQVPQQGMLNKQHMQTGFVNPTLVTHNQPPWDTTETTTLTGVP